MKTSDRGRSPSRHRRRIKFSRGYTLIEILFVITITSAVLGTTVRLVTIAQRSHESSKGSLFQRQEIRRLADDLRDDMHHTRSHSIEPNMIVLVKSESNGEDKGQITYRAESEKIIRRTVTQESQETQSSDYYAFESATKIEFKPGETDSMVQCMIYTSNHEETPFRILAAHEVAP